MRLVGALTVYIAAIVSMHQLYGHDQIVENLVAVPSGMVMLWLGKPTV